MKFVLASRNKHKIKELEFLLGKYIKGIEILSLDDVGFFDEIEENGETFEENSLIKAKAAAMSGYIGIGDDSGLEVDALDGAPGVYSARYAGEHGNDKANNELLLENLKGKEDRSGRFVCALACVFPKDGRALSVRGTAEGEMLTEAHGEGGFGYDPLFYYPPLKKTFGELTPDEKNQVSHRSDAVKKMAELLKTWGIE
ncbi:MAG: XTP/dITP diphosphatase [Ruminococcaceae bacterium]|nr:XTP/dITP diphosphatase [Oscillospiraceae bacterium]